jgi:hypothetical protein
MGGEARGKRNEKRGLRTSWGSSGALIPRFFLYFCLKLKKNLRRGVRLDETEEKRMKLVLG